MCELTAESGRAIILVADDHDVMRASICAFVRAAFPSCVLLEAADGAQAQALCLQHRPRLAVIDSRLHDTNGIELARHILPMVPGMEVIVVSMWTDPHFAEQAPAAGASAYIVKDQLVSKLVPAITAALHAGGLDG